MNSIMQITLGIVTAMGGFVDIGELVFSVQAGVKFGYSLLWAIIVGMIGIILYSELAGRVSAIAKKPVFTLIRERFPRPLGVFILLMSVILNVLTCAAETGGVIIALQLLFGLSFLPSLLITIAGLMGLVWVLSFDLIERLFGLIGMLMFVFVAAVFFSHVNFHAVGRGLIPSLPHGSISDLLTYLYFAVGIISSSMMPYEVYFYSSGGIEEKWSAKSLFENRMTAGLGMTLGALASMALLILGAATFKPLGITPQLHGTAGLLAAIPFGKTGLILSLIGIIFTISGSAIETCLAGAYSVAQFLEWPWGKAKKPYETPKFTILWLSIFAFAAVILQFNIDPVQLVEYAVIFSVLALPFTYYVIMRAAGDKKLMGVHVTKPAAKIVGWAYFVLLVIIALAAIPLMIMTNMGNG